MNNAVCCAGKRPAMMVAARQLVRGTPGGGPQEPSLLVAQPILATHQSDLFFLLTRRSEQLLDTLANHALKFAGVSPLLDSAAIGFEEAPSLREKLLGRESAEGVEAL